MVVLPLIVAGAWWRRCVFVSLCWKQVQTGSCSSLASRLTPSPKQLFLESRSSLVAALRTGVAVAGLLLAVKQSSEGMSRPCCWGHVKKPLLPLPCIVFAKILCPSNLSAVIDSDGQDGMDGQPAVEKSAVGSETQVVSFVCVSLCLPSPSVSLPSHKQSLFEFPLVL
jgi:hypothetical protein